MNSSPQLDRDFILFTADILYQEVISIVQSEDIASEYLGMDNPELIQLTESEAKKFSITWAEIVIAKYMIEKPKSKSERDRIISESFPEAKVKFFGE